MQAPASSSGHAAEIITVLIPSHMMHEGQIALKARCRRRLLAGGCDVVSVGLLCRPG